MNLTEENIHRIKSLCFEKPGIFLPSFDIEAIRNVADDCFLWIKTEDKRSPRIIQAVGSNNGDSLKVIPYFLINERPEAQMTSYYLGKGLCNLAEIRELFDGLYSRFCGSYNLCDLPHQEADQSKIALWVHDCLTADIDHKASLNRHALAGGVAISYDLGMSFYSPYFPPFYTFELGISDQSIVENREFLLNLLADYTHKINIEEESFISQLEGLYPKTHQGDLCRYFFRNFNAAFPKHLYFGRFFEKLKHTRFDKAALAKVADAIHLDMKDVNDWTTLLKQLSKIRSCKLDLRQLNLTNADLRRANLKSADLREVNLAGADLEKADLRGADLRGANFEKANLKGALID